MGQYTEHGLGIPQQQNRYTIQLFGLGAPPASNRLAQAWLVIPHRVGDPIPPGPSSDLAGLFTRLALRSTKVHCPSLLRSLCSGKVPSNCPQCGLRISKRNQTEPFQRAVPYRGHAFAALGCAVRPNPPLALMRNRPLTSNDRPHPATSTLNLWRRKWQPRRSKVRHPTFHLLNRNTANQSTIELTLVGKIKDKTHGNCCPAKV